MAYRVHRFEIGMRNGQRLLEDFLNTLDREVVSIVPNVKRTSLRQIYEFGEHIDHLLVVERLA